MADIFEEIGTFLLKSKKRTIILFLLIIFILIGGWFLRGVWIFGSDYEYWEHIINAETLEKEMIENYAGKAESLGYGAPEVYEESIVYVRMAKNEVETAIELTDDENKKIYARMYIIELDYLIKIHENFLEATECLNRGDRLCSKEKASKAKTLIDEFNEIMEKRMAFKKYMF